MGKRAAAGAVVVATGLVAGLGAVLAGAGVGASAKAVAPPTGAPLIFPADVRSSNTLPALYPAKPPAPGKGVPLRVPAGVGDRANTAASTQGLVCGSKHGFKSVANGKYVAAELDYGVRYPRHNGYGMLRARADHRGPWEVFQFCYDEDTKLWSILSDANKMWVAAETGYPSPDDGMLRARADKVRGPREEYHIDCIEGESGVFAIKSAANDRYVAAELSGNAYTGKNYAMLRARSGTVGPWEKFSFRAACE